MLTELTQWVLNTVGEWGYAGIVVMMAIESSFVPFPSEIVMIPAGYLAYKGEMSLVPVLLAGFTGSMIGAWLNYFLAITLGRKFLYKYGKYLFMATETLEKMERFFQVHGPVSTFSGRLIPGVRQLISIPAGLSKMPFGLFSLYTFLGAGIWSSILVGLGYILGDNEELIKAYLHELVWLCIGLVVLIVLTYIFFNKRKSSCDS